MSSAAETSAALSVQDLVAFCLERRDFFLELARRYGSPLYIIEEAPLLAKAREFCDTFHPLLPDMQIFYPIKANSHPKVLVTMLKAGLGIEVSSGYELKLAIAAGAVDILFNGPAKTADELDLALAHRDRVTVIMDSWTELERLASRAAVSGKDIRTGIRLSVEGKGALWRKFGINPSELADFAERAAACRHIRLNGLHFHSSWNMTPAAQVATLQQLGSRVQQLPGRILQQLEFIDIGGGFWPPRGEWLPTPAPADGDGPGQMPFFTTEPAAQLSRFAEEISLAYREYINPHLKCRLFAEPGRWICSEAASILLTVLDRKGDDIVITDGGTNMVGWEQFEQEYFPVINLSCPEAMERPFLLLGSLCTPRDFWGRSYFGSDIRCNDLLLIPLQGAYTYSLRQRFIKPLPLTVFVSEDGNTTVYED
jgi:diaminopimelate decarboxylase